MQKFLTVVPGLLMSFSIELFRAKPEFL